MTASGMTGKRVVVFGATSAIAQAIVRRLAADGARFVLVARNGTRLQAITDDLRVRHGEQAVSAALQADLDELARHAEWVQQALRSLGGIDLALIAHGVLPDQRRCEEDVPSLLAQLHTNGTSTVSLCAHLANVLEAQGHGCLAVITSVAGDRGRRSNHAYGCAKALVSRFLEGLRARLWVSGVAVVDLRPGFVISPMTAGIDRRGPLWVTPDRVARAAVAAIYRRAEVAYLPWFWRWIMLIIRLIPTGLFKRLSL